VLEPKAPKLALDLAEEVKEALANGGRPIHERG
jgi:hypothetical protein